MSLFFTIFQESKGDTTLINAFISDLAFMVQDDDDNTAAEKFAAVFGYDTPITNALMDDRASRL